MSRTISFAAATAAVLASSVALADPEVGGSFSPADVGAVGITSTNPGVPTIVRSVSIKCPAAGTLLANAEAEFSLGFSSSAGTVGGLQYGISRTTSADASFSNDLKTPSPLTATNLALSGSIQRFDGCKQGQKVTYNFYALQGANLRQAVAVHPRMSVIFLRDHD